ncbi:hypothetical protein [Cyclobacterium roseum]|uniref:hypothetical protein n=1 Tax=Cyclobacterium roseum TaxID=2666137 RepID=UPI001390DB4D|nr:hypothetical protein [Cyclobacterium roseum]
MKVFILLILAILPSFSSKAQVDAIKIIDAVAGTLLPTVVEGVNSIKEARNNRKDEKAEELEKQFINAQQQAAKEARETVIEQIGKDIELLGIINQLQIKVERVNIDVGAMSIFKDVAFIDILISQDEAVVKNQIVRKFFNSLEKINLNRNDLGALRDQIKTTDLYAAGIASGTINQIVTKLDGIQASVNDCQEPTTTSIDSQALNECLEVIKSVSTEIGALETIVGTLNTQVSTMLNAYINRYKEIQSSGF